MREIALDTETTGLDPANGHRVVEIGCVEMMGRVRTGRHFHAYLNPERDMPEEAYAVHGLSTDFLKDKPLFASVATTFLEFIADAPLVIHNAQFDLKFLNYELRNAGCAVLDPVRAVDTVVIARKKFPGAPAKLDALCKRYNIDLSRRTKHGALLDAELLADVYLELMGGRQEALILATQAVQVSMDSVVAHHITQFPMRTFPASEEELKLHAEFISRLKQPVWLQEP